MPSISDVMKNVVWVSFFSFMIISACSSNETKIVSVEKKTSYQKMEDVVANAKVKVEVSGMSCEHACGGSIRMALKETGAVDRVSYDFEDGREKNVAIITYDDSKISPKKMVEIIEEINNKQFTTGKVEQVAYTNSSKATSSTTSQASSGKASNNIQVDLPSQSSWKLPNIFQIFARLIR